jgi:hypothetical protein
MDLTSYDINSMITQNNNNIKDISIGTQESFNSSLYTIYGFRDSSLLNPNVNKYNIGICSIIFKNKSHDIGNNVFTVFKDGKGYTNSEGYIEKTNVFTELGFYDGNTDRSVIGGRINDQRIKKIEITFVNGEVKQPIVDDNGYFILVYNQNKIMKNRSIYYTYTDAIESINAYDKNNKPLKINRYNTRPD